MVSRVVAHHKRTKLTASSYLPQDKEAYFFFIIGIISPAVMVAARQQMPMGMASAPQEPKTSTNRPQMMLVRIPPMLCPNIMTPMAMGNMAGVAAASGAKLRMVGGRL